ncbi:MAG TPA: hypothetical protein VJX66_03010 [Amycolatopsis sp.]|nr:hypothetical protein [Amycolatopsis sp.]
MRPAKVISTVICAFVLSATAVVSSASAATASPSPAVEKSVTVTARIRPIEGLQISNTATGAVQPMVVGACSMDPARDSTLTMTWHYLQGVLIDNEASLFARVGCTSSPAMAYVANLAHLYRNTKEIYHGTFEQCHNCNQAISLGYHKCTGSSACAGNFQMIWFGTFQLPAPWVWSSWPSYCSPLSTSRHFDTIICDDYTGVITIPLTP